MDKAPARVSGQVGGWPCFFGGAVGSLALDGVDDLRAHVARAELPVFRRRLVCKVRRPPAFIEHVLDGCLHGIRCVVHLEAVAKHQLD